MRTLDAAAFNDIAADPAVRPWLGVSGDDPIDLSSVIANPNNFAFLTNHQDGGYLLLKLQVGLYAAHTLAKPSARGKPMLKLMRAGFAFMFTKTECIEIITQLPDGNDNAKAWSDLAGFRDTFRREAFFPLGNDVVGCQFRSLSYQDWVLRDGDNRKRGEAFHAKIGASHAEDPVHDAWVGATIAGCEAHNGIKAINLFNRWACIAGYHQVQLLSVTPPVVDTGEAVLQLGDDGLTVLSTRSVSIH